LSVVDGVSEAPAGFVYQPEFLSRTEESELLDALETQQFQEVVMHGVAAKRTVIHYGWSYGYESWQIQQAAPVPEFLHPARDKIAQWLGVPAENWEEVLVSRYPPGATIGWHRDAPMFGEKVVGLSLLAPCVMKFRRWRAAKDDRDVRKHVLEPRSAYIIGGEARSRWQHHIPAVKELRYSVSFRTVIKKPVQ
jgi:DNA oxidative demethylase